MDTNKLILLLIPIIIIQLILMITNLVIVLRKTKTKYFNKIIWVVVILIFSYIGNIACLILEGGHDDSD